MLPPVVPVSAVCDELQISRKTFRRAEVDGHIPAGAVTEYRGVKYVLADRLDDVFRAIATTRSTTP
jgi:NADH:ubiquinone oxidoreductase subunit H